MTNTTLLHLEGSQNKPCIFWSTQAIYETRCLHIVDQRNSYYPASYLITDYWLSFKSAAQAKWEWASKSQQVCSKVLFFVVLQSPDHKQSLRSAFVMVSAASKEQFPITDKPRECLLKRLACNWQFCCETCFCSSNNDNVFLIKWTDENPILWYNGKQTGPVFIIKFLSCCFLRISVMYTQFKC